MNEQLRQLADKYIVDGDEIRTVEDKYVLANSQEGVLVIVLNIRSSEFLRSQLRLYRDACSIPIPARIDGALEATRSLLAERDEREGLLKDIVSVAGLLS